MDMKHCPPSQKRVNSSMNCAKLGFSNLKINTHQHRQRQHASRPHTSGKRHQSPAHYRKSSSPSCRTCHTHRRESDRARCPRAWPSRAHRPAATSSRPPPAAGASPARSWPPSRHTSAPAATCRRPACSGWCRPPPAPLAACKWRSLCRELPAWTRERIR